ncbi:MAG TPA: hypothetical protein VKV34_05625, partial [Thermoleophilia bacterium]|nr:hypothetical protein [Thermoleophilia bacterium]
LLVSSHPFGLFALFSELVLIVLLCGWEVRRTWRSDRRTLAVIGVTVLLAVAAALTLRHVYAPLQGKYAIGSGGPVVDLGSSAFWNVLGGNAAGTYSLPVLLVLAATVVAGVVALAVRRQRAALIAAVWLVLPLAMLSVLTAAASDAFAPERHLAFLMPGFAVAVAATVLEIARHGRYGAVIAGIGFAALMAPAAVSDQRDLTSFSSGLRNASIYLAYRFASHDVLLTSGGLATSAEDPRLYGAYAVLVAPSGSPLSHWSQVGNATGCRLATMLTQNGPPHSFFILLRPQNPSRTATAVRALGARARVFGGYEVVQYTPRFQGVGPTLWRAQQVWRAASESSPGITQFAYLYGVYRAAFVKVATGGCPGLTLAS